MPDVDDGYLRVSREGKCVELVVCVHDEAFKGGARGGCVELVMCESDAHDGIFKVAFKGARRVGRMCA